MLIEEVEEIWSAIAERDDWRPLEAKIEAVRDMGRALGEAPAPAGHAADDPRAGLTQLQPLSTSIPDDPE
jgi:hypothetical protein